MLAVAALADKTAEVFKRAFPDPPTVPVPFRVFIGFDTRQPLAYTVARSSVERYAKMPVQVSPLRLDWLPITRRGLTEFTYSRWLVPWLCDFKGTALFMDSDTIARVDVTELTAIVDPAMAVSVVQGKQRFEWPSVMFFQCGNMECRVLTPEYIEDQANNPFSFSWLRDPARLGALPAEWNHLVLYEEPNPKAKILHFTAGLPCWPETKESPLAGLWHEEAKAAMSTVSWEALMGRSSIHRRAVNRLHNEDDE